MDSKATLAQLVREDGIVPVYHVPFVCGRHSEKSPEDFMDICVDGVDKTVSREYAIISYSDEKAKSYVMEVKGKQGAYVNKKMVIRNEKCCLYSGDAVSLLKCKFYFMLPEEAVETRESVKRPESEPNEGDSKRQAMFHVCHN